MFNFILKKLAKFLSSTLGTEEHAPTITQETDSIRKSIIVTPLVEEEKSVYHSCFAFDDSNSYYSTEAISFDMRSSVSKDEGIENNESNDEYISSTYELNPPRNSINSIENPEEQANNSSDSGYRN